ncbi:unnamed protein product [Oppiella nova]|uniref:O-acyltransferase n=1 Tax=Oppiella nova TaxID=334625 RepID=A0A7R9LJW7_9ACAR|nr:unnamed protein product [Oppiella nova]CAG2164363.1 unnamed protein product [Oppiella nova]
MRLYADLVWLKWCFSVPKFHIWALTWLKMQMSAIIILYPILRIWLWTKNHQLVNSYVQNLMLSVIAWHITNMSTTREAPTLSQFLYFLYAPTLLYRDNYPRTNKVNWKLVIWYFLQVLAVMFCMFAITWRFVEHNFKWTGIKAFEIRQLVYLLLNSSLVGIQLKLLMFYGLLHCWLNGFAEMMRFGYREFYSDWWNCSDYVVFYRKWNIIVHDWLRAYIFDTCISSYTLGLRGNKDISALWVFLISAVIHEYILAVAFGFFLPVLFLSFFIMGVLLFFVGKFKSKGSLNKNHMNTTTHNNNQQLTSQNTSLSLGNMLMFVSLCLGWGLMVMLYSLEWYSRINCPANDVSICCGKISMESCIATILELYNH